MTPLGIADGVDLLWVAQAVDRVSEGYGARLVERLHAGDIDGVQQLLGTLSRVVLHHARRRADALDRRLAAMAAGHALQI